MKIYYPKDKNGNQIGFRTPESYVFDKSGKSLTDKLAELNSNLVVLNNDVSLKANASALNVEKARIDKLATLKSGSTTGDAELQDIRVGYNGTKYNSAGNSVRGQAKILDEKINNFNGMGGFKKSSPLELEFGIYDSNHKYSSVQEKDIDLDTYICLKDIVHLNSGDVIEFKNPLNVNVAVDLFIYDLHLKVINDPSDDCSAMSTMTYTAENECYLRLCIASLEDVFTSVEMNKLKNSITVKRVPWLPAPNRIYYNNGSFITYTEFQNFSQEIHSAIQSNEFIFVAQANNGISNKYINTIYLLRDLSNVSNIINPKFTISMGNIINSSYETSFADCKNLYLNCMRICKNIKNHLLIQGVDDTAAIIGDKQSLKDCITKDWFYNMCFKQRCLDANGCLDNDKLYYFVDYDNIRVIVLDTNDTEDSSKKYSHCYYSGVQLEQIIWLSDVLHTDKAVIIFSQHSLSKPKPNGNKMYINFDAIVQLLMLFKNGGTDNITVHSLDMTSTRSFETVEYKAGGRIIGCFSNEYCKDAIVPINDSLKDISLDSSNPDLSNNPKRVSTTTVSDDISIVRVNLINRKVIIQKFGNKVNTGMAYTF